MAIEEANYIKFNSFRNISRYIVGILKLGELYTKEFMVGIFQMEPDLQGGRLQRQIYHNKNYMNNIHSYMVSYLSHHPVKRGHKIPYNYFYLPIPHNL